MKDFLKYTLATLVGLILFSIVMGLMTVMSFVGMMAAGSSQRAVKDNSMLVLKLNGQLTEQTVDDIYSRINGVGSIGLADMLTAVNRAADDDKVKGIYIDAGVMNASLAQLQELRDALVKFKKKGKWIVSYGEVYSQGAYYVASVADKVYLNPVGMLDWHGLGGERMFYKKLLAKVGVKMVVMKHGKYKSAPEEYTEERMTEPARQQTQRYLDMSWQYIRDAVAKDRKIKADSLDAYADNLLTAQGPQTLVKKHMIDAVRYEDEVREEIKKRLDVEEDDDINKVSVAEMVQAPHSNKGDRVAVYYLYGAIVNENIGAGGFGGDGQIVAKDVCKDLEDLADDDDVKAVVLRVNSPGGSAFASEQIWRSITLLKKKKPVVVTMGGYAASGGYYIASAANYIFAEPTTLTGSIGIYGIIPDPSELMTQKLSLTFDEVKTHRNSILGAMGHPLTAEQAGFIQAEIDRGYILFKQRVAAGRCLSMAQVEERAQGHVFVGSDALPLHLVDALGGMNEAVELAAKMAKLNEYYTADYPTPKSQMDQMMELLGGEQMSVADRQLKMLLGDLYEPVLLMRNFRTIDCLQARMPVTVIYN